MKIIEGGVCAAKGFKVGAMRCGIRKSHTKKDLARAKENPGANSYNELLRF